MPRPISSKPAVSAWLITERKRVGMKPAEVAARMTALGLPVQEGTVRTWEAGRSPSPENVEGLERVFGSRAPDSEPPADQALVEALAAQTEAINDLTEALRPLADLAAAAPGLAERLAVVEPLVDGLVQRALATEPTRAAPSETTGSGR